MTTLALGLSLTGVGILTNQTNTNAATKYVWTKTKSYQATTPAYHAKNAGQTAYLWNASHTKKLHNAKNYPHTTWYVQRSVAMKHGNKTTVYYQVVSGNKKVTGYIYRGFLTKGKYQANHENNYQEIDRDRYIDAYGVETYRSRGEFKQTLLSTFKGTVADPKLTSVADNAVDLILNSMTGSAAQRDKATNDYYNLMDKVKKDHRGQLIQIENKGRYTKDSKPYKEYVMSQLKAKGINPNDYQGYKIGVSAVSKTENGNLNGSAHGLFEILLVPND